MSGRLADLYGRRRMFLLGLALFGAASALCAAAPSQLALIIARLIQGVGAALVQSLALAIATNALPEERQGWAVGFLASVGTSCLTIGPLVGGALVEAGSWRWIFVLNMPIVLFSFIVAARFAGESRDPEAAPIDWAGAAVLFVALSVLVASLLHIVDWPHALTAGGIVLGVALVTVFVRMERRRRHPLIPVTLLRRSAVVGPLIALLVIQFAVLAVTVYVILYLQQSLDYGPLAAGALLLPAVIWSGLLSTVAGRMADRHGSGRLIYGGLALAAADYWASPSRPQPTRSGFCSWPCSSSVWRVRRCSLPPEPQRSRQSRVRNVACRPASSQRHDSSERSSALRSPGQC